MGDWVGKESAEGMGWVGWVQRRNRAPWGDWRGVCSLRCDPFQHGL